MTIKRFNKFGAYYNELSNTVKRRRSLSCPKCIKGHMGIDMTRTKEITVIKAMPKICRNCGYRTFYSLEGVEVE